MNKKKIQKEYKKKLKLFKDLNKFYYLDSKPKVSDTEYDELKKEILALEKKYEFLRSDNSPSTSLAINPQKILKGFYRVSMLSLMRLQKMI